MAYRNDPDLENLLLSPLGDQVLKTRVTDLRAVVNAGIGLGVPVPGLMMALSYYDAYRSSWLPANLVMAQRDYFGSHTYQRVDAEGTFHTQWEG